jgi:hypothetical protein
MFSTDFTFVEVGGHGTPCPYKELVYPQLDQPDGATVLKSFCSCTMRFVLK